MKLRSGKVIDTMFKKENMPFKLVNLPEKCPQLKRENNGQFKINIDFDESSKAWRKNKINIGQGCFRYKTK